MATKKVVVNAAFQPVGAGSADAAYIFNADDVRLDKHRKAYLDAQAISRGRQAAGDAEAAVERVGTDRPKGR